MNPGNFREATNNVTALIYNRFQPARWAPRKTDKRFNACRKKDKKITTVKTRKY